MTPDDCLIDPPPSDNDKPPRCRTAGVDEARADRLRTITVSCGTIVTAFSKRVWADQMKGLANQLVKQNQDPALIDTVLDWMERAKPRKPSVATAAEFRKHINWLVGLMHKDTPPATAPDPAPAPPDPELEKVLSRLLTLGWPKGSLDKVPAVVAAAATEMDRYGTRLRAAKVSSDLVQLRDKIAGHFNNVPFLVDRWLRKVRERLVEWPAWSGQIPAWGPVQKDFAAEYREITRQYTGYADNYDALLGDVSRDQR